MSAENSQNLMNMVPEYDAGMTDRKVRTILANLKDPADTQGRKILEELYATGMQFNTFLGKADDSYKVQQSEQESANSQNREVNESIINKAIANQKRNIIFATSSIDGIAALANIQRPDGKGTLLSEFGFHPEVEVFLHGVRTNIGIEDSIEEFSSLYSYILNHKGEPLIVENKELNQYDLNDDFRDLYIELSRRRTLYSPLRVILRQIQSVSKLQDGQKVIDFMSKYSLSDVPDESAALEASKGREFIETMANTYLVPITKKAREIEHMGDSEAKKDANTLYDLVYKMLELNQPDQAQSAIDEFNKVQHILEKRFPVEASSGALNKIIPSSTDISTYIITQKTTYENGLRNVIMPYGQRLFNWFEVKYFVMDFITAYKEIFIYDGVLQDRAVKFFSNKLNNIYEILANLVDAGDSDGASTRSSTISRMIVDLRSNIGRYANTIEIPVEERKGKTEEEIRQLEKSKEIFQKGLLQLDTAFYDDSVKQKKYYDFALQRMQLLGTVKSTDDVTPDSLSNIVHHLGDQGIEYTISANIKHPELLNFMMPLVQNQYYRFMAETGGKRYNIYQMDFLKKDKYHIYTVRDLVRKTVRNLRRQYKSFEDKDGTVEQTLYKKLNEINDSDIVSYSNIAYQMLIAFGQWGNAESVATPEAGEHVRGYAKMHHAGIDGKGLEGLLTNSWAPGMFVNAKAALSKGIFGTVKDVNGVLRFRTQEEFLSDPDIPDSYKKAWAKNTFGIRDLAAGFKPDEILKATKEFSAARRHIYEITQKGYLDTSGIDPASIMGSFRGYTIWDLMANNFQMGEFLKPFLENLHHDAHDSHIDSLVPHGHLMDDLKLDMANIDKLIQYADIGGAWILINNLKKSRRKKLTSIEGYKQPQDYQCSIDIGNGDELQLLDYRWHHDSSDLVDLQTEAIMWKKLMDLDPQAVLDKLALVAPEVNMTEVKYLNPFSKKFEHAKLTGYQMYFTSEPVFNDILMTRGLQDKMKVLRAAREERRSFFKTKFGKEGFEGIMTDVAKFYHDMHVKVSNTTVKDILTEISIKDEVKDMFIGFNPNISQTEYRQYIQEILSEAKFKVRLKNSHNFKDSNKKDLDIVTHDDLTYTFFNFDKNEIIMSKEDIYDYSRRGDISIQDILKRDFIVHLLKTELLHSNGANGLLDKIRNRNESVESYSITETGNKIKLHIKQGFFMGLASEWQRQFRDARVTDNINQEVFFRNFKEHTQEGAMHEYFHFLKMQHEAMQSVAKLPDMLKKAAQGGLNEDGIVEYLAKCTDFMKLHGMKNKQVEFNYIITRCLLSVVLMDTRLRIPEPLLMGLSATEVLKGNVQAAKNVIDKSVKNNKNIVTGAIEGAAKLMSASMNLFMPPGTELKNKGYTEFKKELREAYENTAGIPGRGVLSYTNIAAGSEKYIAKHASWTPERARALLYRLAQKESMLKETRNESKHNIYNLMDDLGISEGGEVKGNWFSALFYGITGTLKLAADMTVKTVLDQSGVKLEDLIGSSGGKK